MLLTSNNGSYPRIGDEKNQQRLRQAIAQWEKKKITDAELKSTQQSVVKDVIDEQVRAGLDVVTDGQISWYDPLSHVAGRFTGITINGLLRFFDTNFYFRQPVVTGKVRWNGPFLVQDFRYASSVSTRPVRPVVTGPYTLARLSLINTKSYRRLEDLIMDYAEAVAQEIELLSMAGATSIQIDEPAILKHPKDWPIFSRAISAIAGKTGGGNLVLTTFFGDAAPLYDRFQDLPVEILGFDLTYSSRLSRIIAHQGSYKSLGLGLIDGRNTRIETEKETLPVLEKIMRRMTGHRCYLTPSCGLEYLPRDRARKKLMRLSSLKKTFLSRSH